MSNPQTGSFTRGLNAAIAFLAVLFACSYSSADITYTDSTIPTENITTGSGGVGNVTFNISEAGTYSNVMSGSGSVTKSGAGTLTLSGANTFSGGLTISSGKIYATGGSLGTGKTTNNGGTLEFAIASGSTALTCNISNYNGTKTIKTGSGTLSTDYWISGLVEVQQGTLKLTKQYNNKARRFSGTVTVAKDATLECSVKDSFGYQDGGTTKLNIYGTLNHSASKSNESVRNVEFYLYGGEVKSTGNSTFDILSRTDDSKNYNKIYSYALEGATPENPTVSTISAVINLRATETLPINTAANSELRITNEIKTGGGSCTITKLGPGTLVLSAKSPNFKNDTIISEGKVIANAPKTVAGSVFGTGSILVDTGATLEFQISNQMGVGDYPKEITVKGTFIPSNYTHIGNINLENGVIEREYGYYSGGSGLDFGNRTATITSSGNSTIKSRLDIRNTSNVTIDVTSGNLTVEGVILDLTDGSEIGVGGFTKTGEGALTLSGANTYKGTTAVSEGVLKLIDSGISTNGPITIAENATLEYNVATGTKNAEIGSTNEISGAGKIVKTGDGVMQINAAEGAVDVESLVVSSGRLDMKTYFKGTLEVGEALDEGFTTATFSPGNSVGTLNVDGVFTLNPESTLLMEIGGETPDKNDMLIVSGDLTIAQNSIIYLALADDNNLTTGDTFEAQIQAGTDANDYKDKIFNSIVAGWPFYDIEVTRSGNVYTIHGVYDPNAVPEPSTWALLVLGVAGLMYWRKRK